MTNKELKVEESERVRRIFWEALREKRFFVALFFLVFRGKIIRLAVESRTASAGLKHSPFVYVIR